MLGVNERMDLGRQERMDLKLFGREIIFEEFQRMTPDRTPVCSSVYYITHLDLPITRQICWTIWKRVWTN